VTFHANWSSLSSSRTSTTATHYSSDCRSVKLLDCRLLLTLLRNSSVASEKNTTISRKFYALFLCLYGTHAQSQCCSLTKLLPYKSHCYLLPLLSDCWALEDEICRQSLNFTCNCLCNSHCYLLPLLSDCWALEDEICRQSLNFTCNCLCNIPRLVNAIANSCSGH
jgi:hypothetical protein